jgi:trehalose-phosphatase
LTDETEERLQEFFAGFRGAGVSLLLLDYDGTLAPFHVNRFQARPWPGVRELLNQIQNQTKTRMVVVSGRPGGEIVPLLNLDMPPEIWGLHGAERLLPDGSRQLEVLSPHVRAKLAELGASLHRDSFGGLFEQKPNAAVMHWRGATSDMARLIEQRTRELFEPLTQIEGLTLLEFECGLELRAGRDKGAAVKAILQESGAGKSKNPVAFLGDDFTDETAFAALKGHGLSVLVRQQRRESLADVWVRPPDQLRSFLERWIEACSAWR